MPGWKQGDGRGVVALEREQGAVPIGLGPGTDRVVATAPDEQPAVAQEEECPGDHGA